jgi:tripartite-type tricarboxylate transporter receptor subunit TctC
VLQRLEAELQKAMATPAMKDRLATMGAMPGVQNAAGFTQVIRNDIKRWGPKPGTAEASVPATTSAASATTARKP